MDLLGLLKVFLGFLLEEGKKVLCSTQLEV